MNLEPVERNYLAWICDLLVAHRGKIGYLQRRPMASAQIDNKQDLLAYLQQKVEMDCTEPVQLAYHVAGLRSPSGPRYGWTLGNTDTMKANLPHYTNGGDALVGAIVVFSRPDHAAIVRHPGVDPVICSHGNASGPQMLALSVEQRYHTGPTVFLNVSGLG